ncbi:MAG: SDR family oxidoreductase [Myxococcota bacterium]
MTDSKVLEERNIVAGRVAIVTGAGGGLGRSHARLLASQGARVVVNDLGGSLDGTGSDTSAADQVVAEIRSAGGEAVASHDDIASWEGGQAVVETALNHFGTLDIVINNAGILRDSSLKKMTEAQWEAVLSVHLSGTMHVTKAAWSTLCDKGYGRIVTTTSAAGLYGNFGQSNYSSAKMGVVGLTNTLAQEGAKYRVRVNAIAPIARSRMTETILPPPVLAKLEPEFVSPVVLHLCSEELQESGRIYAVGGGYVARVAMVEGVGVQLPTAGGLDLDEIRKQWSVINELTNARPFGSAMESIGAAMTGLAADE